MQTLEEIEKAVTRLPKSDLRDFRDWFDQYDQNAWDKQFEEDADSGKLDSLADQAISEFKAGQCKEM